MGKNSEALPHARYLGIVVENIQQRIIEVI